VSIVMGLDQHRGQITGEWIDTETGEVQRTRVAPVDRAAVRKFLQRFRGEELEVALEATTGWRFVVEELRRVGASVHLAEPAETAGLRGPKKRAKGDRADARHLRELLMVKRLPESWIPPDHILDLRARVRLRHTVSEQRGEWQQRIQATLYHRGYYEQAAERIGGNRACLSVARKLLKRSYHTLRELGEEALAPRMTFPVRAKPFVNQMRRGRLPAASCRHLLVDGPERPSGRNASPSGITPSHIMSPAPEPTRGSWTEVRLGARAHTTRTTNRAHAPPPNRSTHPTNPDPALDTGPPHK
jgi:hypothetical protein